MNSEGVASVSKFFHNPTAATAFIEANIGKENFARADVEHNDKISYVLHNTTHPNDFDYAGKSPQEVLDSGAHVIPANNYLSAERDIEALKLRSGDDTVHQVMIVSPDAPNGAEVRYLHA